MNIAPIFRNASVDKRTNLHIGIEIRYEEQDAEELMHMLEFIVSQKKEHKKLPKALLNGTERTIKEIMDSMNQFEPGRRSIRGVISLLFLDPMRPLFEGYFATLEQAKEEAKKKSEWNEEHPLYKTHPLYQYILDINFPPKKKMN